MYFFFNLPFFFFALYLFYWSLKLVHDLGLVHKLRHAWNVPCLTKIYPLRFGLCRVTLYFHFQCISAPRHALFCPSSDRATLDFRHAWRNLWTRPKCISSSEALTSLPSSQQTLIEINSFDQLVTKTYRRLRRFNRWLLYFNEWSGTVLNKGVSRACGVWCVR